MLALDQADFDQDLSGGWREVSYRAGCELAASDLLRDYRNQKLAAGDKKNLNILYWHEGQMRASAGETDAALELFRQTYKQSQSWNYYVDGTIAFLENDRSALLAARNALAALPEPDHWDEMVRNTQEKFGFSPKWPNNLNVLEGFVICFGKPYSEAYGDCGEGFLVTPKASDTGYASSFPQHFSASPLSFSAASAAT